MKSAWISHGKELAVSQEKRDALKKMGFKYEPKNKVWWAVVGEDDAQEEAALNSLGVPFSTCDLDALRPGNEEWLAQVMAEQFPKKRPSKPAVGSPIQAPAASTSKQDLLDSIHSVLKDLRAQSLQIENRIKNLEQKVDSIMDIVA